MKFGEKVVQHEAGKEGCGDGEGTGAEADPMKYVSGRYTTREVEKVRYV